MFPAYAQNNAKNKKKWLLEGNKNIDSTKHFLGTKDVNPLIFKTNSTERMRITSSGFIGIGTPAPTFPVDINTTARIKNITTDFVHISKGLVIGDLHFCRGNSCTVDTVHTTQQRDLLLQSNNLLGLVADTVRVENPVGSSAQLKVAGSISAKDIYINSGVLPGEILTVDSTGKIKSISLTLDSALIPAPVPAITCSTPIIPWRKVETVVPVLEGSITFLGKGNVGIGVCFPTAKLHVNNTGLGYDLLLHKDTDTNFVVTYKSEVGIGVANPNAVLEVNNSFNNPNVLILKSDNIPLFYVGGNGNVGIGTKTPTAKFEILDNTGNGDYLNIGTNSNSYLYINSTGQVGIGTTNVPAGFTMAVCGKVLSKEMEVQIASWCDYVFEEGYQLMPWEEVVNYYKTHKHLPGVPSEKEVLENGLELGEMNSILLKKIEELHLYIEQLEKRISDLEKNKK